MMVRLRIIHDAYSQLRQDDPDTAITMCALRRMVKAGDIPSVHVGRKNLVDYDLLLQYLHMGSQKADSGMLDDMGEIRKIP